MRLILAFALILSLPSYGEYRAYRLAIRNLNTGTDRQVLSTLDHLQYTGYYPLQRNEVVYYVSSWRCRGRTDGFKPLCREPEPASPPKPNSTP